MRSVVGRCVCNVVTIIILVPAVAVVSDATVTICTTRFNFPPRTNLLRYLRYSKTPSNLPHLRGSRTARRTKKCYRRLRMLSSVVRPHLSDLRPKPQVQKIPLLFLLLRCRRRISPPSPFSLAYSPSQHSSEQNSLPLPRGCKINQRRIPSLFTIGKHPRL